MRPPVFAVPFNVLTLRNMVMIAYSIDVNTRTTVISFGFIVNKSSEICV